MSHLLGKGLLPYHMHDRLFSLMCVFLSLLHGYKQTGARNKCMATGVPAVLVDSQTCAVMIACNIPATRQQVSR